MSNTITAAHVFSVGTWNGKTFDAADLDAIVAAFERLAQSGRVPLKFGHNTEQPMTDGQPALGWVSRLWREGGKLLADFADIPSEVYRAIERGLYKFTSIELLADAERDGETFPYVLDAVALLGAEPPAVTGLSDLSKLAAARATPALKFASRTTYACTPDEVLPRRRPVVAASATQRAEPARGELERLRAEIAALKAERETFARREAAKQASAHRDALVADIEAAVRDRRIFPAAREALTAALNLKNPAEALRFSRAQVATLIKAADQSAYIAHLSSSTARDEGGLRTAVEDSPNPATLLFERVQRAAGGDPSRLFSAWSDVVAVDPEAREAAAAMVGEYHAYARHARALAMTRAP